jgi:hypothetical protein
MTPLKDFVDGEFDNAGAEVHFPIEGFSRGIALVSLLSNFLSSFLTLLQKSSVLSLKFFYPEV